MTSKNYSHFIAEAMIEPVRSVLIVDDEYPTLEDLLDGKTAANLKPKDALEVIRGLRANKDHFKRPPIIDIHNGTAPETAEHLHQSDLLILDYFLKGVGHGGDQAIAILRMLIDNPHFNLIVVHSSEADTAFEEIVLALLSPGWVRQSPEDRQWVEDTLHHAEGDVEKSLRESIKREHYLYARGHGLHSLLNEAEGSPRLDGFIKVRSKVSAKGEDVTKKILIWCLAKLEEDLSGKMAEPGKPQPKWSKGLCKWVWAGSAFIAFSHKAGTQENEAGDAADGNFAIGEADVGADGEPVKDLVHALNDWKPRPSRLLLAKIRATLESKGVLLENEALGNDKVLANWYYNLLAKGAGANGTEALEAEADTTISRHAELLVDTLRPSIDEFFVALVKSEQDRYRAESSETGKCVKDVWRDQIESYFGVDWSNKKLREEALFQHNAFVCTKVPQGQHLRTGHVFQLSGPAPGTGADHPEDQESTWICLSPMCDLVPGQASKMQVGTSKPFVAVHLKQEEIPNEWPGQNAKERRKARDDFLGRIGSNRAFFFQDCEGVRMYCINDYKDEGSNPHWRMLLAKGQGQITKEGKVLKFKVFQPKWAGNHRPVWKETEATIVGQLRYEYALNLVQKLGVSLSRVGLDFETKA